MPLQGLIGQVSMVVDKALLSLLLVLDMEALAHGLGIHACPHRL